MVCLAVRQPSTTNTGKKCSRCEHSNNLLLLVLWVTMTLTLGSEAAALSIVAKVETTTVPPTDTATRVSNAFAVNINRISLVSATYSDFTMSVTMDIRDDTSPNNDQLRAVIRDVHIKTLEAHSLLSVQEKGSSGSSGLLTDQQLLYVVAGASAVGAAILTTIVVMCVYQRKITMLRGSAITVDKGEDVSRGNLNWARKHIPTSSAPTPAPTLDAAAAAAAAQDKDKLWQHIHSLEQQTSLLLALNETEEDHAKIKERVLSDPKLMQKVRKAALPDAEKEEPRLNNSHVVGGGYSPPKIQQRHSGQSPSLPSRPREREDGASCSPPSHLTAKGNTSSIMVLDEELSAILDEDKPWWYRDAETAIKQDHLPPPTTTSIGSLGMGDEIDALLKATDTKGLLTQADNVELISARRAAALDGHWSVTYALPPLSSSLSCKLRVEGSNIHGVGVFAKTFIEPNTLLFPYLRGTAATNPKLYLPQSRMAQRFGADWGFRLGFVCPHPTQDLYCVAEDPSVRGWGCLLNSRQGTALDANCEVVWGASGAAGSSNSSSGGGVPTLDDHSAATTTNEGVMPVVPWVRTKSTIPPLSELLLDYYVSQE